MLVALECLWRGLNVPSLPGWERHKSLTSLKIGQLKVFNALAG